MSRTRAASARSGVMGSDSLSRHDRGIIVSVMPSLNLTENERNKLSLRISEAMDHLDRANAIFNYVLFSLSGFSSTDDPKWDYKFVAMANLSRIIDVVPDDLNSDTIMLLVAKSHLPVAAAFMYFSSFGY